MESDPYIDQDFEIEIDETPVCPRQDFATLDYTCDNDGLLEPTPHRLERRGISSQAELWQTAVMHTQSVVSRLLALGRLDLAEPLKNCHTEESAKVCTGCKRVTVFFNRCERFYCPTCQPRLARERRESVEWWAKEITEPKHVVLTVKNVPTLTKGYVQWFKQCFGKLRRRKFARNWKGGFYRLEITNESNGWHLHLHALINSGWIEGSKLATEWADVVGQTIAIVKVKDVHSRDYLAEVTKYAVKGSQIAGWSGDQIAEFIDAFTGVKTFGVFGTLYGKRTEFREWIDQLQQGKARCECGCENFRILSASEMAWEKLRGEAGGTAALDIPPPRTPDLPNLGPVEGQPPRNWTFEPRK